LGGDFMKRTSRARAASFPKLSGLMFDVDGTLLLSDRSLGGYELLPHAVETLNELANRGVPYVLLTNGSAYPPAQQAEKLRKLGLAVRDEQMITPSSVAAELMVRQGIGKVLVLGSDGVGHALREAGIETRTITHAAPAEVEAVYVGWHPDCGMKDIEAACNAIFAGAKLYVASDVPFFATRAGRTIGYSYAIVGAIRRVTRAPIILTGKPSRHAMQFVAKRLGVPVTRVGVVGDDPVVEMSMARRFGAAAFAVTTGVTSAAEWRRQPPARRPHRVLADLRQLLDLVSR
jgi:HAD superfamily hydrolase (TIGR01450 family)